MASPGPKMKRTGGIASRRSARTTPLHLLPDGRANILIMSVTRGRKQIPSCTIRTPARLGRTPCFAARGFRPAKTFATNERDGRRWDHHFHSTSNFVVRDNVVRISYWGMNFRHGENRPNASGIGTLASRKQQVATNDREYGLGLETSPADRFLYRHSAATPPRECSKRRC